jgi:hypothetical protein
MKKFLLLLRFVLPMFLVITFSQAQQQTMSQNQNNTQAETKSFVYQNVRITVTKRGIVAGDLRTGKVIWRDGFWQNPTTHIVMNEFRFFGEYLYIRVDSDSPTRGASLRNTLNGKVVVNATDFYLKEGAFYYFDTITYLDMADYYFTDISILEFNSVKKEKRFIRFSVDKHIEPYCRTDPIGGGISAESFILLSKNKNIWTFRHTNKKCDMRVTFDDLDLSKFSINIKRKN